MPIHVVLLVEEERKNAAESDEPAERHCIEPAEPIGFRLRIITATL